MHIECFMIPVSYTHLIRTRVGDVRLEDCLNPEHFKEWIDGQEIENEEETN